MGILNALLTTSTRGTGPNDMPWRRLLLETTWLTVTSVEGARYARSTEIQAVDPAVRHREVMQVDVLGAEDLDAHAHSPVVPICLARSPTIAPPPISILFTFVAMITKERLLLLGIATSITPELIGKGACERVLIERDASMMSVPAGTVIVPPVDGNELIAISNARVSLCCPSPLAPTLRTLIVDLPIDTLGVLEHQVLADAGDAVTLTAKASPARISDREMRLRGCAETAGGGSTGKPGGWKNRVGHLWNPRCEENLHVEEAYFSCLKGARPSDINHSTNDCLPFIYCVRAGNLLRQIGSAQPLSRKRVEADQT